MRIDKAKRIIASIEEGMKTERKKIAGGKVLILGRAGKSEYLVRKRAEIDLDRYWVPVYSCPSREAVGEYNYIICY